MIGTTPTHKFRLTFDTSFLSAARVVYMQKKAEVLRKDTDAFTFEGNTLSVTLSQEETFLFDHMKQVEIQLRVLTKGGDALNSHPIKVSVQRCLDNEVLA